MYVARSGGARIVRCHSTYGVRAEDHLSETQHACRSRPLPKLGIAGEVTGKIKGGTVVTVATGQVEIAIRPVSELVNVPGIDFVGPVPEEVQYLSIFSAAIVAGSKQVDAGE
jgi:hypothetical protein